MLLPIFYKKVTPAKGLYKAHLRSRKEYFVERSVIKVRVY